MEKNTSLPKEQKLLAIQKELEEAEARLLAEKEAEEEEKRRKENSLIHKMMRGFKKFVKDTISEEE